MKHKIISTTTKKKYIGNRTIATAYRIPAVSAKARRFSSIPKTLKIAAISVAGVLESLKNEIVERVFSESEQGGTIDLTHIENPLPFLTACTDILNSYEYFEEFVRGGPNADMFLTDLKDSFAQRVFRSYVDSDGKNAQDAIFVIRFLTAGVLDIYTEWLKTDKQVPFLTILSKCAPIVSAGQNILANAARIR